MGEPVTIVIVILTCFGVLMASYWIVGGLMRWSSDRKARVVARKLPSLTDDDVRAAVYEGDDRAFEAIIGYAHGVACYWATVNNDMLRSARARDADTLLAVLGRSSVLDMVSMASASEIKDEIRSVVARYGSSRSTAHSEGD